MSFITPAAPAPIAYSVEGAANAVGLSVFPIKQAITAGLLTAHYSGAKRLVGHADLLEWFNNLPVDKPATRSDVIP